MKIYLKIKYTPEGERLLLAPSQAIYLFFPVQLRSVKCLFQQIYSLKMHWVNLSEPLPKMAADQIHLLNRICHRKVVLIMRLDIWNCVV